jgi:antitoxin VapB
MSAALQLPRETERLARLVAARVGRKPEEFIRAVIEREAKALGITDKPRRRPTIAELAEFGEMASRLPILDPRSPEEIADDLNET